MIQVSISGEIFHRFQSAFIFVSMEYILLNNMLL